MCNKGIVKSKRYFIKSKKDEMERIVRGKRKLKKEQGITLVALVITVIIIIILTTVAINFAFGDNGLINRAEQARDFYANDTKYTEESMSNVESYLEGMLPGGSGDGGDEPDVPEEPTLPDGWDGDKVTPEESSDGVTVPVPIGYTASKATGETSVNDGFVIYEGTEEVNDGNVDEAKTSRNQFVWIPVPDISQIANQTSGTDNNGRQNYQGKLYDFSLTGATEKTSYGQGTTSYREPDIVTDYDGTDAAINASYFAEAISSSMTGAQFRTQLQEEFNEMIESVDTYGGFYIGRYETGNLESNITTEPVVVKENESISKVNWYYMYQNSKKVAANSNVVSTMIWGSMWDRTLIWLTETGDKTYAEIDDSTTWGNYNDNEEEAAGSKQPTGTSEAWKVNNIYDLAGNVDEWTLEAGSTNGRFRRGGSGDSVGSSTPVSNRDFYVNGPSYIYIYSGTRSALYVK